MTVSTLWARIRAFFASLNQGSAHLDNTDTTATTTTSVVASTTADTAVVDATADVTAAATGSDAATANATATATTDTTAVADQSALGAVVAAAAAAAPAAAADPSLDADADDADAEGLEDLSAVSGGTDELVVATLKAFLRFGLKLGHDLEDLVEDAYAEAKALAAKL